MRELAATTQDLGKAIAYFRGDRTQAELAIECGLTRAAWSLYESGKRRPTGANLAKILRVVKASGEELEEVAWQFRRRRLSAERAGRPVPKRRSHHLRELQAFRQWGPGTAAGRLADPELAAILARLNAAMEELVISVLRRSS